MHHYIEPQLAAVGDFAASTEGIGRIAFDLGFPFLS